MRSLRSSIRTTSCFRTAPFSVVYRPIERLGFLQRHATADTVRRPLSHLQCRLYQTEHVSCEEPTIYALSTASGRAAIAVIRVSGPACREVSPVVECDSTELPTAHANCNRYTKASAPLLPSRSLGMRLFGNCTRLMLLLRRRHSSIPAH